MSAIAKKHMTRLQERGRAMTVSDRQEVTSLGRQVVEELDEWNELDQLEEFEDAVEMKEIVNNQRKDVTVYMIFGLLWLELVYLESQRLDASFSSLSLKFVLIFIMAALVQTLGQLIGVRPVGLMKRLTQFVVTSLIVQHIFSMQHMYSRPAYIYQAASQYLPSPVQLVSKDDKTLVVPGYVNIDNESELKELYTYYSSSPEATAESIQAGMQWIGRKHVCITNTIYFDDSDMFSCQGPRCLQYLRQCMQNPEKTFSIVPLEYGTIKIILIANHETREIEMYDPNGLLENATQNYTKMLESVSRISGIEGYRFSGQSSFGFQFLDHIHEGAYRGMDPLYIWWYTETRFLNPSMKPQELDRALVTFLNDRPFAIFEFLKPRIALITGIPVGYFKNLYYREENEVLPVLSANSLVQSSHVTQYRRNTHTKVMRQFAYEYNANPKLSLIAKEEYVRLMRALRSEKLKPFVDLSYTVMDILKRPAIMLIDSLRTDKSSKEDDNDSIDITIFQPNSISTNEMYLSLKQKIEMQVTQQLNSRYLKSSLSQSEKQREGVYLGLVFIQQELSKLSIDNPEYTIYEILESELKSYVQPSNEIGN